MTERGTGAADDQQEQVRDPQFAGGDGAAFDAVIAVGSNIGDKAANIAEAVARFGAHADVAIVGVSPVYKTPPWGITDQPWFTNGCFTVRTSLSPHDLLAWCLEVERQMGRVRAEKWGPRVIDLDVLVYRGATVDDVDLKLPHPHIQDRAFVLVPLKDVAPNLRIAGEAIDHWLAKTGREGIEALEADEFPSTER